MSFVLMAIMVSYRVYEIKSAKPVFSVSIREKSDKVLVRAASTFVHFFLSLAHRLKLFLGGLTHSFNEKLHAIWRKISSKVDRYFLKLRGRKDIGKKGSISIYWQQVAGKKEGEEGDK